MDVKLSKYTLCVCAGCGHVVLAAHDCDAQHVLNATDPPLDGIGRLFFIDYRGELIARMARSRS